MLGVVGTYQSRPPGAPTVASAQTVAGIAGSVVADTGPLPQGDYDVEITLGFSGIAAAGKHIQVEHRNAANNAVVQEYALCPAGAAHGLNLSKITLAANERIRAILGAVAAGAGEAAHACIRAFPANA